MQISADEDQPGAGLSAPHARRQVAALPLLPLAARRSRKDEVYLRLRQAILAGQLGAGSRIVPEDVARSMGVSRTPVVQALDRLAREALLETLPNGRVVVADHPADVARELSEIRTALEAYAGRLAAQRRVDAETLARLRAVNAELAREVERLAGSTGPRRARAMERVMALNLELHHLVTAASGNRRLVRLLEETLDLTALQPVLLAGSDAELQRAVREHALVIEALDGGDGELVERTLREHVLAPFRADEPST